MRQRLTAIRPDIVAYAFGGETLQYHHSAAHRDGGYLILTTTEAGAQRVKRLIGHDHHQVEIRRQDHRWAVAAYPGRPVADWRERLIADLDALGLPIPEALFDVLELQAAE